MKKVSRNYREDFGRPAKPIRLMVALIMLKHIRNLSDESVVEQWSENGYYQYFSGGQAFTPSAPCEASELVHFRNRIGSEGIELILKESIRINGKDGKEDTGSIDTTVQEKNITYPTDNKLHRKMIKKCHAIAEKEGLELRQSYTRTLKRLGIDQRFRSHPKNGKKARRADRRVKTIAGRLVRELSRKLTPDRYAGKLALFTKILQQRKQDGHKAALEQQQRLTGHVLKEVAVDRGYRGTSQVGGTQIHTPKPFSKKLSTYQRVKRRKGFSRRAAIEPKIGHLKADHRLSRNFYKGIKGDDINVMLAAAAMNFKRMMNIWKKQFWQLFYRLVFMITFLTKSHSAILNLAK